MRSNLSVLGCMGHGAATDSVLLAAQNMLAVEREGQKILVEIKSFLNYSLVQDLKDMIGSYNLYLKLVREVVPEYKLYVAVPKEFVRDNLSDPFVQLVIGDEQIPFIVVDVMERVIIEWIS